MFLLILNKHDEYDFHNSKIMEFMRLIYAKSIGFWWGSNIHNISFESDSSELHD